LLGRAIFPRVIRILIVVAIFVFIRGTFIEQTLQFILALVFLASDSHLLLDNILVLTDDDEFFFAVKKDFTELFNALGLLVQLVFVLHFVCFVLQPFQADIDLVDQLELIVNHVVDPLSDGRVSLDSFLSLRHSLLLLFNTNFDFLFKFLLIFVVIGFDALHVLGQVHQLLPDLLIRFIHFVYFEADFVDLQLCAESGAGVTTFD
jgi:hypothetical protein